MRLRGTSYIFCILFSFSFGFGQSDSLLRAIELSSGKEKIEALHLIIMETWLNYPDQAMAYGEEAFELSTALGDSMLISKSLRLIAGVYFYRGDFEFSLEYNTRAFDIAVALNDSSLINNGYNNIGLLYYNLGNYQLALEFLLRAINMKEKIGERYGMAITLNNIGLVYHRVGNYVKAEEYFKIAYERAYGINKKNDQIYSLNNAGFTYLKLGDYESAFIHFRDGWEISKENDNTNWGASSLRGLGSVFLELGILDSSHYYLTKSLTNSQVIDDKKGIAESHFYLSKLALKQGDFQKALEELDEAHQKSKLIQLRQQQLDNLDLYAEIYRKMGIVEMENRFLKAYIDLSDSLFQDAVYRNLELIPVKLKEEEDRFLLTQQQSQIQEQAQVNQRFFIIIIIIAPLVLILIILLRKNNKKHRELQLNNEELKKTQKLLITSEKMASLGVLAAGVGHEINNPLNFIKNGIEALSMKLENNKDEELKSYFDIINEGVNRATNIVKSLSHFSRKGGPDKNEECNIHEIIENCLLILHNRIRNRVRIITNFTKENVLIKGNEGRLHQAMMNIIGNAEQAIMDEGTIDITTRRNSEMLEIIVKDDGEGIPEENLMKISDPFFTTKAPGEGTGLGLFITFSIIEEHEGHIEVQSNIQEGTTFYIKLPL